MFNNNQIEELVELLSTLNSDTKIYFGCDSVRTIKKNIWYARYATVVIVHKNGNKGCRLFSHEDTLIDYDTKYNRPRMRLMNETIKVCEAYVQLAPFIDEFDCEIHLDINTDPQHGSSCVAKEAAGYVLGMTGLEPKLKPLGFAASYGADGVAHGRSQRFITT